MSLGAKLKVAALPLRWVVVVFVLAFALGWASGYTRPPSSLLEVWCHENMGQMVSGGACMLGGRGGEPVRYVSDVPVDARRGIERK